MKNKEQIYVDFYFKSGDFVTSFRGHLEKDKILTLVNLMHKNIVDAVKTKSTPTKERKEQRI